MYFWKYILAKKAGLSQKKCNMALYGLPVLPIAEAFEKTVTGNPISVSDALAQDALSLQVSFTPTQDGTPSIDSEPTTEPYLSKVIPRGNKEYYSLVGGTVAWNQLVQNGDFESSTGWTLYPEPSGNLSFTVNDNVGTVTGNGTSTLIILSCQIANIPISHKLFIAATYRGSNGNRRINMKFGSAETVKAIEVGSSWNTTSFIHSKTTSSVNFNLIRTDAGSVLDDLETIDVKDVYICDLTLMFGSTIADYIYSLEQATEGAGMQWLKDHGFFTKDYYPHNPGELISVKTSGHKVGSTTYPLSDTELRGLFKLDSANKLYAEGDVYPPSGSATRNYEYRAYQSGDESLTDAITDGTHTVVKLATPTTESATPYTSPIDVEAGGTEEFVDNRTVPIPVGNETYYASEYAVHGKTGVAVSHGATGDDPNPTEYEVEFTSQGTVYGGTVDIVTGVLTVTWGYIASYNGETLPGEWMSSKDVYASGTTPSTGAEVAYELATPQTYNLTLEQVTMLLGSNYLETEDGTITLTYMAKAAERVRAMNARLNQNKKTLALKKANSLSKGDLK